MKRSGAAVEQPTTQCQCCNGCFNFLVEHTVHALQALPLLPSVYFSCEPYLEREVFLQSHQVCSLGGFTKGFTKSEVQEVAEVCFVR